MNIVPQKETAAVGKGHFLYPTPEYSHWEYFWMGNATTKGKAVH